MEQLKIAAKDALRALEQAGATRAAVTATQTKTTEFNMADGEFTLLRTLHDDALALTGFDGGRKGTIGLNRFDEGSVAEAAQSCRTTRRGRSRPRARAASPAARRRRTSRAFSSAAASCLRRSPSATRPFSSSRWCWRTAA